MKTIILSFCCFAVSTALSDTDIVWKGKCDKETKCACPPDYSPICGTNGETFSNECELNCAGKNCPSLGLSTAHSGECVARLRRETITLGSGPVHPSQYKKRKSKSRSGRSIRRRRASRNRGNRRRGSRNRGNRRRGSRNRGNRRRG